MKTKTILIGVSISGALFLIYWFFIRKGKKTSPADELAELEETFKNGNPYKGNAAEPLNNTYNVSESSPNPPFKAEWLPSGGGEPRELISKAQFDAKVYTTIKQIISDAKKGNPKWLESIKTQMLQSWRPISLSGNNTSLAEALAYEARYYTAAAYYYQGPATTSGPDPIGGPGATTGPPAMVVYMNREFTPTDIENIYISVSSASGTAFLDIQKMEIINAKAAQMAGVIF